MPLSSPPTFNPAFYGITLGAAGTVLTSTGASTAPTFQAGGGGAVDSVNGQTGVVVLDAADVGAAGGAANTFTGTQQIDSTEPRFIWNETDQAADEKMWDVDVQAKILTLRTRTDADGAGVNVIAVTRGTGTAIANISVGNAANNPTFTFLGTGTVTCNGAFTVPGGLITIGSSGPTQRFNESDQGTDLKNWSIAVQAGVWTLSTITDANAAGRNIFTATRGATVAVSNISFGNATDNNTFTFLGTGTVTASGTVQAARFAVTSSTAPNAGIYASAANTVGISANTTLVASFNASNGVIFTVANFLARFSAALPNGAAAAAGTLLNAPAAGDPTKWIPVDDNGTTRYVPAW